MNATRRTPTPSAETPVVLIAERDTGLADSLASEFSNAGYMVCTAADGQEALDVVEQLIPDLMVLDLDLPTVPGATVLEHLRRDPATHGLPILGLCSLSYREAREAMSLGADDCLIKPVTPDDVADAAAVVLERSLRWQAPDVPELVK